MQVAGAVLTGGASTRMGRAKMLVDVDGRPMARRVCDALASGGCNPIAMIGGSATELESLELPVVEDLYPGDGPLGGTITALRHFESAPHVLVAACDLALLDAATVRAMLAAAGSAPGAAAVVAHTDRNEPGLVLWNQTALEVLTSAFTAGMRAVHRALTLVGTTTLLVDAAVMLNVNRPDDVPGK